MNLTQSQEYLSDNLESAVTLTITTKSGLESDITGILFASDDTFYISDHPSQAGFMFSASDTFLGGEQLYLK